MGRRRSKKGPEDAIVGLILLSLLSLLYLAAIASEAPRYACALCRVPVYLVRRPEADRFFFRHTPPVTITLPAHAKACNVPVQPHSLETYDRLKERSDD